MTRTASPTDDDFTGLRMQAAQDHIESIKVAEQITGMRTRYFPSRHESFLDGWDHAMKVRYEELLEENTELHSRLCMLDINGPATVAEIDALRSLASTVQAAVEEEMDDFWLAAIKVCLERLEKATTKHE